MPPKNINCFKIDEKPLTEMANLFLLSHQGLLYLGIIRARLRRGQNEIKF